MILALNWIKSEFLYIIKETIQGMVEAQKPRHLVEQLGLFKMPRQIRNVDKDQADKTLDNKLINKASSFFNSRQGAELDEEGKEIDKQALAV